METRWMEFCTLCTFIFVATVTAQVFVKDQLSERQPIRVAKLHQQSSIHQSSSDPNIKSNRLLQPISSQETRQPESTIHSRQKRMIWITDDGRLALPPGTVLSISPTISMPLVRYPPSGFLSNLTMSFPLTIDFDKLGLTDNENPFGVLPPVFGRSMGRAAGSMLAHYVGEYLHTRRKRETDDQQEDETDAPHLPEAHRHVFHGGERAILYGVVEDLIKTFGFNGKACILRTICEVHSKSIHHLGLFGEMAKLFFTASKSKYSELLPEYVIAEQVGLGSHGPGECFPYYKDCPRSLFKIASNRYSEPDINKANDAATPTVDDLNEPNILHVHLNEINEINNMDDKNRFQM